MSEKAEVKKQRVNGLCCSGAYGLVMIDLVCSSTRYLKRKPLWADADFHGRKNF
jgi:hypothetical protein